MKKARKQIFAIMLALLLAVAHLAVSPTGVLAYEDNDYDYMAEYDKSDTTDEEYDYTYEEDETPEETPNYETGSEEKESEETEKCKCECADAYENKYTDECEYDLEENCECVCDYEQEYADQDNDDEYEEEEYDEYPLASLLAIAPFTEVNTPLNFADMSDASCPNETWDWDATNRILELNDFVANVPGDIAAITVPWDTTVEIRGTNTITTTGNAPAISAPGPMHIVGVGSGSPTLIIDSPNATGNTSAITAATLALEWVRIDILSSRNGIGGAGQGVTFLTLFEVALNIVAENHGLNFPNANSEVEIDSSTVNITAGGDGITSRHIVVRYADLIIDAGLDSNPPGTGIRSQSGGTLNIDNAFVSIASLGSGINSAGVTGIGDSEIEITAGSSGIVTHSTTHIIRNTIRIEATLDGFNSSSATHINNNGINVEAGRNGIVTSGALNITNGSEVTVDAGSHGLVGNAAVRIESGSGVAVTAGDDGVRSLSGIININYAIVAIEAEGSGIIGGNTVNITMADITIESEGNGIHGTNTVTIDDSLIAIDSGGNGVHSTTGNVWVEGFSEVTIDAENNGIQCAGNIHIRQGSHVTIQADNNGLLSTGHGIFINDADVTIEAGNNGMQAGTNVNILNGSEINVTADNNGLSARDVIVAESDVEIDAGRSGIFVNNDNGSVTIRDDSSITIESGGPAINDRDGAVEDIDIDDNATLEIEENTNPDHEDDFGNDGDDDDNGYDCEYCNDEGCEECETDNGGNENGYDCEYCNDEGCEECEEDSGYTPTLRTVTVTTYGSGTATTSPATAAAGTQVTITATPASGHRFVRWEVVSGGVTLSSNTTATATFTMPAVEVSVRAVFQAQENNVVAPPVRGGGGGAVVVATSRALPDGTQARITRETATLQLPTARVSNLITNATNYVSFNFSGIAAVTTAIVPRAAFNRFGDAELGLQLQFQRGTATLSAQDVVAIDAHSSTANITIVMHQDGNFDVYIGNTRFELAAAAVTETVTPAAQTQAPTVVQPPAQQPTLRLVVGQNQFTQNGVQQTNESAPFISEGRTMIPLRVIAEALGANVDWNEATRSVIIISGDITLNLPVGEPLPGGMGEAMIVDGRTFVPVRYVSEMLGAEITWDDQNRAVYVN
ncbi:MAG: stalk domain-containing protein [Defluviitaleaceae bacterium]|nr:stalk domain-containing protein [Defluviitaleaceae bacterium]